MQTKITSKQILKWYYGNKRELPFRFTKDPYKIWISEVMLQQTQMKTVIPFYNRWVDSFPTIQSVARTKADKILKSWEGLGYYRRCLNFHKASKIIMDKYDGRVPNNYESFRSLPGVGEYTAGAVLSIAFGVSIPAIDGNVNRLMSRLNGIKNLTKRNRSIIKNKIKSLLIDIEPGDLNQGLMEIGALVCIPKNPLCYKCPLSHVCKAYKNGSPELYPITIKKSPKPHLKVVTAIIWRKNKFFIQKRSKKQMLGGLWEFPGGKVEKGETLENALIREIEEECLFTPVIIKKAASINHAYSHFTITIHCYHCKEKKIKLKSQNPSKWIAVSQIDKYSFPKANHKLFNFISKNGWYI
mgnify:CR=1 FL=1